MILMIDHYDSFTYNLVDYFYQLGQEVEVHHFDEINLEQIHRMNPDAIILSPGPGHPEDIPQSMEIVDSFKGSVPILGICLGFQIIVHSFGGKVVEAKQPMHGKVSYIEHDQQTLFEQLPQPLPVTRYHSLIAETETLPESLTITSKTEEGVVMSVRASDYHIEGVQFHPEAILTEDGLGILKNFLSTYLKKSGEVIG
ncbi:aminodeoxychorismate/anthranilate synthase component II [Halalkalibacillus sediminis]|uniref:Aminodeoxychorismate/anthranilate synthase component II n=1 Tax=Halalkalibacillus sediminis TaxID=2018042 RepID=A0A2I0QSC1_9BACI|nr:aminodeoxychorismate/anthranilate synthase component II [Halalkalibacillus sediminis]PKR77231.1 aminodeoxychorismate/anthranilate synthase component II [Halalkalibacillus sediminis]